MKWNMVTLGLLYITALLFQALLKKGQMQFGEEEGTVMCYVGSARRSCSHKSASQRHPLGPEFHHQKLWKLSSPVEILLTSKILTWIPWGALGFFFSKCMRESFNKRECNWWLGKEKEDTILKLRFQVRKYGRHLGRVWGGSQIFWVSMYNRRKKESGLGNDNLNRM